MSGPSIWFCSPAWGRLAVSEIVFEQRADALEKLRARGIEAEACVVADDENLDLARSFGFATVERNNDFLGCRFNDSYQMAAESGADYLCPIGSDSWLDPTFMAENLPALDERVCVYSRHYAVVRKDGRKRANLLVSYPGGTSMMYPTATLAHCNYRPIPETAARGCDGHTVKALEAGGPMKFLVREKHSLETVSFQTERQLTQFDQLMNRWGVGETDQPFEDLDKYYPAAMVERVKRFYADRQK